MEKFNSKALTSALDKAVAETSYTLKGNCKNDKQEVIPAILHHPYGKLKEQFVPFTESYALKQLGFDEECFGAWIKNTELPNMGYYADQPMADLGGGHLAPLWQQGFNWFQEKYKIVFSIEVYATKENLERCSFSLKSYGDIRFEQKEEPEKTFISGWFTTIQKAKEGALKKLIEIIKINGD